MAEFIGRVVAEWLIHSGDDRDMLLVEPFSFIDDNEKVWAVPSGTVVNGASIPSFLWSFGPPFIGDYRRASVIHDHYCVTKTETWQDTHRVFLHCCLTDGVSQRKAKTMFAAVYSRGPRWVLGGQELRVLTSQGAETFSMDENTQIITSISQQNYQSLVDWVYEENPSVEEIENRADNFLSIKAQLFLAD